MNPNLLGRTKVGMESQPTWTNKGRDGIPTYLDEQGRDGIPTYLDELGEKVGMESQYLDDKVGSRDLNLPGRTKVGMESQPTWRFAVRPEKVLEPPTLWCGFSPADAG